MSTYRPVDSKREEYRKYLERAGVMESLTRVLVLLYEEQDKGIDALEYVRNHLMENHPSQNATEEELRSRISELTAENNMLRKRLSQYEEVPPPISVPSPSKSQTSHPSDVGSNHSGYSKTSASSPEKLPDQRSSSSAQKE